MRILIQVSKWAIWARRLGSLALPMLAVALALHHLRLITSDVFVAVALTGGAVAALAVLAALVALVRLWFTGDQGWSRALSGLFLGAVCLLPFGYYGSLAMEYPPVTDLATVNRSELPLVFEPGTASMPPPKVLGAAEQDALFPNAKTRTYPLGLPQTFQVVRQLVEDNGWAIRFEREPGSGFEPGQINAQIVTLPGWREEAVIRVGGGLTSSVVDVRSASLNAQHDFGSNGKRVESFLVALDDAITTLLRDNPNANTPIEAEPEEPVETEDAG